MAVSTGSYMKGFQETTRTLGHKATADEFTMEIKGFEHTYLLVKTQFWPELSVGETIEIPTVLGSKMVQPAQVNFTFQKSIALQETNAGVISKMLVELLCNGGTFDAKVYHGTPQNFVEAREIIECHLVLEMPETDFENRTQPLLFTGQIAGHYYGETITGNVPHLYGRDGQAGSC